ncbi:MAG TPA: RNA polymerase sigma factor SigI [Acidimicrobiales bacterium]|nr:RNA polymerase sigma factor SigI [Acidimicrobiales bacterium]
MTNRSGGPGLPGGTDFSEAWTAHRAHLVDVAFRMLGDIGGAEDVVQEAFSRLAVTKPGEVQDARGWLTVVTSRLCLDRIRSARSKHELVYDFTGEPSARLADRGLDPADRVTLDDSVRLALLVMMQRLSAPERVVLVLHDVFKMRFEEIAETVGRPVATCRQLARRARQRIESEAVGRRFDVTVEEHREVTERFMEACARGDLDALVDVLAPDASGEVDLGVSESAPGVAHGGHVVAANLISYWSSATMVSLPGGAAPAVLGFRNRRLAGVLVLTVSTAGDRIDKVHVIADPAKLAFLSGALEAAAATDAEGA